MKNKIEKKYLLVIAYVLPAITLAQGLVPCGGKVHAGTKNAQCGFEHIGDLIQNIITFLITGVYPVIFTISLVWAGILMLTAGGNVNRRQKAVAIIKALIYGLIIMLTAWLIVYTILNILGVDNTPLVK